METTKDPMEVLRQEVSASKMLNDYFHELVKENGGISSEDIQEFMAASRMGLNTIAPKNVFVKT